MKGVLILTRTPVSSSNLKSVGYDQNTEILEVEFHSGGIYQYSNVPSSVHIALMSAGSVGSYFNQHVKNKYSFKQIR